VGIGLLKRPVPVDLGLKSLEDHMSHQGQPVIVGAGPVGLGAALFLARQGQVARVVEMRDEPSQQSRALAVNPRTLDILEPTGVTSRMLERGSPIHGVRFHRRGRIIAQLSFAGMHPRYPFMLALSQATSEQLLTEALEAAGGEVERGLRMVECRNVPRGVEAILEPTAGGSREVAHCPWLLGADGARSTARQQLGVEFAGSSFQREWHLADAPLRTELAADHAHVFFLDGGAFHFMIRVVDETLNDRVRQPIWRVMGNRPEPLSQLILAEPAGPPVWTSSFHVSHLIGATLSAGNVYLAGDAAHLHSPIGARGMNLGLEDAWVFAELVRTDRLQTYDQLRRPVDRRVVRRVELLSRVVSAESRFTRFLRALVFPLALKLPLMRGLMVRTVSGLDHKLPDFVPPSRAARGLETVKAG
jgi:2-polyprenyl-6-methoxyphenol hydroxylase-like FAD-dependent oxidoreductase